MSRHLRQAPHDTFPITTPVSASDVAQIADGSVAVAVRTATGLAWALLVAGAELGTVKGTDSSPRAATLSGSNMTLTANANGSINALAPLLGGLATWAVGDRVGLDGMADPIANGAWVVFSVGNAGAPWVLVRALDARTAPSLPVGRQFFVREGTNGGRVWIHDGTGEPVPGTDPLVFTFADSTAAALANAVTYLQLALSALGGGLEVGAVVALTLDVAAGGAGARDVAIFTANAPRAFEVIGASANVQAAGALGSTVQVRTALGGAGDAVSGPIATDATGRALEAAGGALVALPAVAAGGSLVLRFTDGITAGRFTVLLRGV